MQAVNSVPRRLTFEDNKPPGVLNDALTLKSIFEIWPPRTWFSPRERVLYQFSRLHRIAEQHSNLLQVIRSRHDVTVPDNGVLALLAVEGLSCLESNLDVVDEFFEAGARIL